MIVQWVVLLAVLLLTSVPAAAQTALQGQWRPAKPGERAIEVRRDDRDMQAFAPARLTAFPGGDAGSWVLLWPEQGRWPATPWVLEVSAPALQSFTLYLPDGASRTLSITRKDPRGWPMHGRLGFRLPGSLPDGVPLRLHVDTAGVMVATVTLRARSEAAYLQADEHWLVLASACFAAMLTTALIALFFGLRLRDITFVHYAVYVCSYSLVMAVETGYLVHPLGLEVLGRASAWIGRLALLVSILSAVLFLVRFADMRTYLPGAVRWLHRYVTLVALLAIPAVLRLQGLERIAQQLVNPLLALGALSLLGCSVVSAWRGSRYARYFLLGWTPLLLVVALGSLQDAGIAEDWAGSNQAALLAGAFEALVLSLALAERNAELRSDRDRALRLADTDALTGLLNRGAWDRRLNQLLGKHGGRTRLSVLFLDLDHFKRVNDTLGHAVGDRCLQRLARAMRVELRHGDLAARYGGEEFVAALPGADQAAAIQIAERIRLRFQSHLDEIGECRPTVSIGVASRRDAEPGSVLLQRADAALYAAKQQGRDRVVAVD